MRRETALPHSAAVQILKKLLIAVKETVLSAVVCGLAAAGGAGIFNLPPWNLPCGRKFLWNLPGPRTNLESGIWNLEPGSWNLEPGTWNLEPGTWNLEPGTWNLEPLGVSLNRRS
jgi:hypothetical protein